MAYFLILPAYLLLLLALGVAALVARMTPQGRPLSPYLIGGMIGSVPGIILANVLVTLLGILPVLLAEHFSLPDAVRQVLAVCAGAMLLLGPFAASAAGVLIGFIGGCWFHWRRRKLGCPETLRSNAVALPRTDA